MEMVVHQHIRIQKDSCSLETLGKLPQELEPVVVGPVMSSRPFPREIT